MSQAQLSSTSTAGAQPVARRRAWTTASVVAAVAGSLVILVGIALAGAGGTGLWADLTQRDGGYVTTAEHSFSTAGAALATEPTRLGAAGVEWLYSPGLLGTVRLRVTPSASASPLFVGIAPTAAADRYLAGVGHTVVADFFDSRVALRDGGAARSAPGGQPFWVASATGRGTQTLTWKPAHGSWTVVVMNADGRDGLAVRADLGARLPAVRWVAIGVLVAGAVFLVAGALLVATAIRRRPTAVGPPEPHEGSS